MRLRTLLIIVVLVLVGAAGAYLAWDRFGAPAVASVHPVRGTAAEVVYATGTVEPDKWAKVIALQRKRIVALCDCEGKVVKKGDALGQLDDTEARAAARARGKAREAGGRRRSHARARRAVGGDADRTRPAGDTAQRI
jgi:multidrug efflux pump subunit AcrA (membrane-fusion protein)